MSAEFFCSWSGGKDACLALQRAIQAGGRPAALLTMMIEDGLRSRAHGLPQAVLQRQARSLGLPLTCRSASWQDYEQQFLDQLGEFKNAGILAGVFGDIDLEPHREWVERVCRQAGLTPYEPLWQAPRRQLLEEFLDQGFQATIVAVKQDVLAAGFLGRSLDQRLIGELEAAGVDASGEEGEYHTVVTAGPIFSESLRLVHGQQHARDGYYFMDVAVCDD